MELLSQDEIRRQIRRALPERVFESTPWRALLFIPLNVAVGLAILLVAHRVLPWYDGVLIAVGLGQVYATLGFLVHDLMHGSMLRGKRAQHVLGFFGLYPFLVSPITWRVWHVMAHHGNTNTSRDPDAIVMIDEYAKAPIARFFLRLAPSSRNRVNVLPFFLSWFTLHGQEILWFAHWQKHWQMETYRFDRLNAALHTFAYILFWASVWAYVGPVNGFYVVLAPMMVGNIILLAFITTQHTFLQRAASARESHPLENTVSVRVPWLFDVVNLNFSHHVEHHLFPSMNYANLPRVREWLRTNMSDDYIDVLLWEALREFLCTPRVYADREHLCFPDDVQRTKVDTRAIRARMLKGTL